MSHMTMNTFPYSPLTKPHGEIRLLHPIINPQSESQTSPQPTTWTLTHEMLDEHHVPYYALSYTWDVGESKSILINGISVCISANLDAALRNIKLQPSALWVDALCINQKDNAEKSLQVQQMQKIYQTAQWVLVWLGPADKSSDWAMRRIYSLSQMAADCELWKINLCYWPNIGEPGNQKINARVDKLDRHLRQIVSEDMDGFPLYPIANIMKRRWWQRVWTLQEIAVAQNAYIMCGSLGMTWRRFRLAFDMLNLLALCLRQEGRLDWMKYEELGFLYNRLSPALSVCDNLDISLQIKTTFEPLTLQELLVKCYFNGRMEATDSSDRIFALLGLATDREQLEIKVDYTNSVKTIFIGAAQVLLRQGFRQKKLDLLSCCIHSADRLASDLPSWVPDWRASVPNIISPRIDRIKQGHYFGDRSLRKNPSFTSDEKGRPILILHGYSNGSILALGDVFPLADTEELHITAIIAWLDQIKVLSDTGSDYPATRAAREEAVWKTAIADWEFGGPQEGMRRATEQSAIGYQILTGIFDPENEKIVGESLCLVKDTLDYRRALGWTAPGRRPFVTSNGHIGLGPESLGSGDQVFLIQGTDVPFALRRGEDGKYQVIGELYVHGLMDVELRLKHNAARSWPRDETLEIC